MASIVSSVRAFPENRRHLRICDEVITSHVCSYIGHGGRMAISDLAEHVGVAADAMLHIVSFAGAPISAEDRSVSCHALCGTLVSHCERYPECNLPAWSDLACYSAEGGVEGDVAEVDVRPLQLIDLLMAEGPAHPDVGRVVRSGPSITPEAAPSCVPGGLGGPAGFTSCNQVVERLMNMFRVFPVVENRTLAAPITDRARKLASAHAKAKAFLSTALDAIAMTERLSGAFGDGSGVDMYGWFPIANGKQVKATLNAAYRDFVVGYHYIFPESEVLDSRCSHNVVAYMVKNAEGFEPTVGPVCETRSAAFGTPCGLDKHGKKFMYLCDAVWRSSTATLVMTLLHEALHHAGPGDLAWDREHLQKADGNQVHNCDNFVNYALEVSGAMWTCLDMGTCNASSCTSNNTAHACKFTCDQCLYHSPGSDE